MDEIKSFKRARGGVESVDMVSGIVVIDVCVAQGDGFESVVMAHGRCSTYLRFVLSNRCSKFGVMAMNDWG